LDKINGIKDNEKVLLIQLQLFFGGGFHKNCKNYSQQKAKLIENSVDISLFIPDFIFKVQI
jgi:hypothetical protein